MKKNYVLIMPLLALLCLTACEKENGQDGELALTAPSSFTAATVGIYDVTLSWNPVEGATSYTLELSKAANFNPLEKSVTVSASSFSLTELSHSVKYYVRIKSLESTGEKASEYISLDFTTKAAYRMVKTIQVNTEWGNDTTYYTYNERNMLSKRDRGNGLIDAYQYDADNRIVRQASSHETCTYAYEANAIIANVANSSETYTRTYALNSEGRISGSTYTSNFFEDNDTYNVEYVYNADGFTTKTTTKRNGAISLELEYEYNLSTPDFSTMYDLPNNQILLEDAFATTYSSKSHYVEYIDQGEGKVNIYDLQSEFTIQTSNDSGYPTKLLRNVIRHQITKVNGEVTKDDVNTYSDYMLLEYEKLQ